MFKKTYSTKINVIANFAGSIWMAIFSIIFVPLYLPYIGIEAYGLIGFFTSIQAFIGLLDFGLSPTLNRELAKLSAFDDQAQAMHDLKRTLEIPNWITAFVVVLILAAASPLIAIYWVQPKNLTVTTIMQALIIMSVNIAIQFLSSFYMGGLLGLQKQVHLNIINIISSTLRSAGAWVIVAFVSPTIQAFLLWQGLIAVFQLISVSLLLKLSLPNAQTKGSFNKDILQKVWKFAVGMTGNTFVSFIITQSDKVILSRMLTLEDFGYYSLAITISGMAVLTIVSSITNSVYPRFSKLVSIGDEANLRDLYHKSCQILSAFLIPIIIVIATFSYQILLIWTRKEDIAENTYLLLSIVAISYGLNGLMWLPYHLQLAYGWTKLSFYIYLIEIIILIPLMIAATSRYGAVGGTIGFGLLNVSCIFILIQIMHRRLLKGEQWKWYLRDVGVPLLVASVIIFPGKWFFSADWPVLVKILYFGFLTAVSFAGIVVALPQLRQMAVNNIMQLALLKRSYN